MEKLKKLSQKDMPRIIFVVLIICVIASKLVLGHYQSVHTWINGAPLDDELMFEAAQSITAGQWLGDYNWLTLSKQMFFAVWLALCNLIGVSYLVAGQALLCLASFSMMQAFKPILQKRWARFILFAALAYSPAAAATFTLRVYRDNIFPSLCIFFFAGMIGAALRYKRSKTRMENWLFLAGIGLGLAQITREDGIWLLPFAIIASFIILWYIIKYTKRKRKFSRCLSQILPYFIAACCIIIMSSINYAYYGVFTTSDFSSGSFASAYGAMTRIEHENEHMLVPVPKDVREKLYDTIPELAPLEPWLEDYKPLVDAYTNADIGDYQAGSFYWALRHAAEQEGVYNNAKTAETYWQSVADAINTAIDNGELTASVGERNSTTPIIKAQYVAPTLLETLNGLWHVLTFADTAVYHTTELSYATAEDAAIWEEYLGNEVNYRAVAGESYPYYSPRQLQVYTVFGILNIIYIIIFLCFFAVALFVQGKNIYTMIRQKSSEYLLIWLILFGLFSMAIFRTAMIAFMEVAAFNIGTQTMYLSTVHPLFITFAVVGMLTAMPKQKQITNETPEIKNDETPQNDEYTKDEEVASNETFEQVESEASSEVPNDTFEEVEYEVPTEAFEEAEYEVPNDTFEEAEYEAPSETFAPVENITPSMAFTEVPIEIPSEAFEETEHEAPSEAFEEAEYEAPSETFAPVENKTPSMAFTEVPIEIPTEAFEETEYEAPTEAFEEVEIEPESEIPPEAPPEVPSFRKTKPTI